MMQQEKHQLFMHETLICIIHPHQTSGIISKELAHKSSIPSKTLFSFYFRLLIDGESFTEILFTAITSYGQGTLGAASLV